MPLFPKELAKEVNFQLRVRYLLVQETRMLTVERCAYSILLCTTTTTTTTTF